MTVRERPFLFMTTILPGTWFGGAQRSASLHGALRALGPTKVLLLRLPWHPQPQAGECDFVIDAVAPGASEKWFYRRRHLGVGPFRTEPALVRQFSELSQREGGFRGILCRYMTTLALDAPRFAPAAIDLDDVPTDLPLARVPGILQGGRRSLMRRWVKDYQTVLVTKNSDLGKVPHSDVRVLPCISTSAHHVEPKPGPPNLLFLGASDHVPNAQGVERFVESVWPRILQGNPETMLTIAGRGWERYSSRQNVRTPGFVASIDDAYRDATVVICPIWSGAGSCVKLAEAIGFGMPVVATTFAADGYAGILEPGRDLLASNDADELADQCLTLLGDPLLRARLSTAARTAADAYLSQAAINRIVAQVFG
jgi:hypothetical protein